MVQPLYLLENTPSANWREGWTNPTDGLNAEEKREIFIYWESNLSRLGRSSVNILRQTAFLSSQVTSNYQHPYGQMTYPVVSLHNGAVALTQHTFDP